MISQRSTQKVILSGLCPSAAVGHKQVAARGVAGHTVVLLVVYSD